MDDSKKRAVVTAALLVLAALPAAGQEVPSRGDDVERLREEVERLTEIVERLDIDPDPDPKPDPEPLAEDMGPRPMAIGAISPPSPFASGWIPELSISVFGDAGYSASFRDTDVGQNEERNTFDLGDFVLFLSSDISDRVSFFSEVVLETETSGVHVDLERIIVNTHLHPRLDLRVGRGHTALSRWNRLYHHGSYLQTSIGIPAILGSLLPRHFVGGEMLGNAIGEFGVVSASFAVANGRGVRQGLEQNVDDVNQGKMVSFVVGLEPEALIGAEFFVGYTWDQIPDDAAVAARINGFEEHIASASMVYDYAAWRFMAEGHLVLHEDQTDNKLKDSHGGYAQLSRRYGNVEPYYRFEWLEFDDRDAFYSQQDSLIHIGGVRWDFAPFTALKVEYRRTDRQTFSEDSGHVNVSFGF